MKKEHTLKAKTLLSAAAFGAMAISAAGLAIPTAAFAQERPRGEDRSGGERRGGNGGAYRPAPQPRPQAARPQRPEVARPQPQQRPDRGPDRGVVRGNPSWTSQVRWNNGATPDNLRGSPQNNDRRNDDRRDNDRRWNNNDNRPDRNAWGKDRRDNDGRDNEGRWNNDANRPDRNAWGKDRRDNDRRWNNNANRPDRNGWGRDRRDDDRRWSGNDRRWDRNDWRRDSRYDWQRYRDRNRSAYRMGGYYAPYRDYSYRRLSIGFSLGSMFYGSNYWINDPWQYRLPPVYGAYRWVRYYDDVLLVDTYSGEVVDVIYDFFW
jgi:hypothetical protein